MRGTRRFASLLVLAMLATTVGALLGAPAARADSYTPISGEGSSWAENAINDMAVNVRQFGITVNYAGTGSTAGRKDFLNGTVDFAASDIPFQFHPEDGSQPDNPAPGSYAYIPVVAGGTSFMYNLKINGQRVTNLRMSGPNVAKIFTGVIKKWNDPALVADNPGLTLPDRTIVPVVRSDGSGSTAQFTQWMVKTQNALWMDYCQRSGRAPACGFTSFYPTIPGMIAQSGDPGIAGYVSNSTGEGSIGYVNYSYAISTQFPVVKVLNAAGYYTEPNPLNVAVSLLQAQINRDPTSQDYLTQILDNVYTDPDPRTYPLSSYSYFILPTTVQGHFNNDKGKTLSAFAYYGLCQEQQHSESLGYSPLPINLVQPSLDQVKKIPGAVVQSIDVSKCDNPTFTSDGHNRLADIAPQPQACDKQGPTQCAAGTGGSKASTPVKPGASGGAGGTTGGSSGGTTGGRSSATAGGGGTTGGTTGGSGAGTGSTDGSSCDPTLSQCSDAGTTGSGDSSQNLAAGQQVSTVLSGSDGWGSSQALIVLVALMTLGIIIVPPLLWLRLGAKR